MIRCELTRNHKELTVGKRISENTKDIEQQQGKKSVTSRSGFGQHEKENAIGDQREIGKKRQS
jgi:hypothetical protein